MTDAARVLAVAHDPGGAEALAPVLTALSGRGGCELSVLAGRYARTIFTRAKIPHRPCDIEGTEGRAALSALACGTLAKRRAHLVLTATSFGLGLECAFIRAARAEGIPSLTVLDLATNYRLRFMDPGERCELAEALPDIVTVMDAFALEELRGEGFPAARLRVVGQPAFDAFAPWARSAAGREAGAALRTSLKIPEGRTLCVFFSQPISALCARPGGPEDRGYDERQALQILQEALAGLAKPVSLVVKLHPKESPKGGNGRMSARRVPTQVVGDGDADALVLAADIIVGMTSTMLVKGFLAGKPVVSLQPGLRGADRMVLARMGLLEAVTEAATLRRILRRVIDEGKALPRREPPATWTDGRSVARILALVDELLIRPAGGGVPGLDRPLSRRKVVDAAAHA